MIRTAAVALISLTAWSPSQAQSTEQMLAPMDLSTPEEAVYSMMRAMYQGDAEMVDRVFHETATLRRVTWEAELRPDGLQRWRDWVGSLAVGDAHEELFSVTSEQHGPLATVWAPFVITYQGERVGCGVNTLTLARFDQDWRVIFGMDTSEPRDTCGDFETRYRAQN